MKLRTASIVYFLLIAGLLRAADDPKSTATSKAIAPQKSDATASAAEFAKSFADWKQYLAKLTALKTEYPKATDQRKLEIAAQWKDLMAKAPDLEETLITSGIKAYRESPNADAGVRDLLVSVLADWTNSDDYEKAYQLGKLLIDNKAASSMDPKGPGNKIPLWAGLAAYGVNEFDAAESYLNEAKSDHSLNETGERTLEQIPATKSAWEKEKMIRAAEAKADDLPRVLLKTSQGDIELELFENEAPNTVASFLSLVEKGFYNGLTFHRVLPGFMAQGGCPKGTGEGDPGYHIPAEFTRPDHRLHFRGSLAMARSGAPDSAGSQFYLMFAPNPSLDIAGYTVFGRMVSGFDVLAKIKRRDPTKPDQPAPDKIIEAKVLRKRQHEYTFKKAE